MIAAGTMKQRITYRTFAHIMGPHESPVHTVDGVSWGEEGQHNE